MSAHVDVAATVTAPGLPPAVLFVGSYPVDMLPIPAEWRKARKAVALDAVGHWSTPGDGYRVSFSYDIADAY